MKKLYFIILSLLLTSCLSYKISRIYKPNKTEGLINGLKIEYDSASFEHAMFQDRLKLEFITENKETNSTLYSFYYFKPDKRPIKGFGNSFIPYYQNTREMDIFSFEKNYKHFLVNEDTLLFNNGIKGVEQYVDETGISQVKISDNKLDDAIITLIPNSKKLKRVTNSVSPFEQSTTSSGYSSYNPTADGVLTVGETAYGITSAISSIMISAREEKIQLKSIHKMGSEITSLSNHKDIVLLHEYKVDVLPTITDAYKLIGDFTLNEICSPPKQNQNNYQGIIKFRIVDKKISAGHFWMVSSILLVFVPNLIGYPISSQKVKLTLEATIYDENNHKTMTYVKKGTGRAFSAMYWGYGFAGAGIKTIPNNLNRTAHSKAIYSALKDIKRRIIMDKDKIEN